MKIPGTTITTEDFKKAYDVIFNLPKEKTVVIHDYFTLPLIDDFIKSPIIPIQGSPIDAIIKKRKR